MRLCLFLSLGDPQRQTSSKLYFYFITLMLSVKIDFLPKSRQIFGISPQPYLCYFPKTEQCTIDKIYNLCYNEDISPFLWEYG